MLALMLLNLGGDAQAVEFEQGDYKVSLEGYYRVRGHHFNGLYTPDDDLNDGIDGPWPNEPGTGRYMQQRLRLRPGINFDDRAEFYMMADALENTVFGDNEQLASTSLFANDPTDTDINGQPGNNFQVKRAWAKFATPLGVITVGRQPSNWGLGLLANDGDGFDDHFGENYYGNSFDRFVFATKPLAISEALTGKGNGDLPLFMAVGFDRLVEDPLTQYYPYECDADDPDDDARCAESDDHGRTEDRETTSRPDNWWTEHDDDVWEMIYVLIYRGEDVDIMGSPTDLTAGAYVVNRRQVESSSNVWIIDAYARMVHKKAYFEAEGLTIRGKSSAIALPGAANPEISDPLYKEPNIWGTVARAGYTTEPLDVTFESGFASGDDNIADEDFTGRSLHADYNVGMLLYEEVLARVTRQVWTEAADGLWSQGGVYNSWYVYPNFRKTLLPGWNLHGAFLVAIPHKPDGAIILEGDNLSPILGWEADAALKIDFQEHMKFSVEGAFGQMTDRIPWETQGLTKDGRIWTTQTRVAYVF
jgi:hypothetical protein